MQKQPLQDPERFDDPLGSHMRAAVNAHRQHLAQFPPVAESYEAFYANFTPETNAGMGYLAGIAGIIGSELQLCSFAEGYDAEELTAIPKEHATGTEKLGFSTHDGQRLALLDPTVSARLTGLLKQGWVVRCFLAYTVYCAEEKAFTGTFACLCYSPALNEEQRGALESFICNIVDRIAGATHPSLELTQEQFTKVLESKGAWFLTKEDAWPPLPKGSVYYRRRRSLTDRLTNAALKGNKGCLVGSWLGLAVLVIGLAVLVYLLVVR
ncbi:MAG: hypothetical protein LBU31_02425 [Coriobacteriales bacterium]|jgi:hypothetical protein|nr:hypothetical protein [Coriobacteriales bacterium]